MGYGKIISQCPRVPDREYSVQFFSVIKRPVQICLLGRRYSEPMVVLGQIGFQKRIPLFTILDPGKPHFFDDPVLERPKQPLNPSLGLRRIGMDHFYPELLEAFFEMAQDLPVF
jgi:hypothetical protein